MTDNWVKIVLFFFSLPSLFLNPDWSPPSVKNVRTFELLCVKWWVWHYKAVLHSWKRLPVIIENVIFKGLQAWFVTSQIAVEANPAPIFGKHKRNMWGAGSPQCTQTSRWSGRHLVWSNYIFQIKKKTTYILQLCSCHLQGFYIK